MSRIEPWTGWKTTNGLRRNIKDEVDWPESGVSGPVKETRHLLVAPEDEADPDRNHVHLKHVRTGYKTGWNDPNWDGKGEWVVAAIKIEGERVTNRRLFLDRINAITGLSLSL